jgi:hypothetical protein
MFMSSKYVAGAEVKLHTFLASDQMEVCGYLHTPGAELSTGEVCGYLHTPGAELSTHSIQSRWAPTELSVTQAETQTTVQQAQCLATAPTELFWLTSQLLWCC